MVDTTLILKLESLQEILPPIIKKLKDETPVVQGEISRKIIKALQALGGDTHDILVRDFGVFHLGREGELRVLSEWAYQADLADHR